MEIQWHDDEFSHLSADLTYPMNVARQILHSVRYMHWRHGAQLSHILGVLNNLGTHPTEAAVCLAADSLELTPPSHFVRLPLASTPPFFTVHPYSIGMSNGVDSWQPLEQIWMDPTVAPRLDRIVTHVQLKKVCASGLAISLG
jgi:hypothetical protein